MFISGFLTYDFVPHRSVGEGLDYDNIEARPIRGATVYVVDADGQAVGETTADHLGAYRIPAPASREVRIQVAARLFAEGTPGWDFAVTDNTNGNAVYVMEGGLVSSGAEDSARDLHAPSGWTGSGYGEARVAAPFAILDAVYEAKQLVLEADPAVIMPAAELRWSVNNRAISGSRVEGQIGTSFYDPFENNMYILGDENNDTDEYDKSVIQHEWAHYLEDRLSRSDSIGGPHSLGSLLDMRLAFGEGFANAFSGIAGGQSVYVDSAGIGQQRAFRFSLEQNAIGNRGWFSQNSVGKIVYDIADENNEGEDNLSLGFTPIYNALTASDYLSANAFTSIYLFADVLKNQSDNATDAALDQLLAQEQISGVGVYGEGESNDSAANISFALPVYNELAVGERIELCGNNRQGEYNGLDVRRYVRVTIAFDGNYTVTAVKTLGLGERDPDINIFRQGQFIGSLNSRAIDRESGSLFLVSGEYIFDVFDFLNTDDNEGGGSSCFDVSVN